MKKLITILLMFSASFVKAQTVIPSTTTVDSLSKLSKGSYRFFRVNKDTVDFVKDTVLKCPTCPTCPTVDSAGIINAYLITHPCPTCPTAPKQRTVVSWCYNPATKQTTFTYDDGSTSIL